MFLVGDVYMSKKNSGNIIDAKRRRQNDSNKVTGRPLTATIIKPSNTHRSTTEDNGWL